MNVINKFLVVFLLFIVSVYVDLDNKALSYCIKRYWLLILYYKLYTSITLIKQSKIASYYHITQYTNKYITNTYKISISIHTYYSYFTYAMQRYVLYCYLYRDIFYLLSLSSYNILTRGTYIICFILYLCLHLNTCLSQNNALR